MNLLYSDSFIHGYKKLAEAVQRHGSKLVVQISHAGRQIAPDKKDLQPIAPSSVPDGSIGVTPRVMTEAEIAELIEAFVQARVRTKQAGCDGLQVHKK